MLVCDHGAMMKIVVVLVALFVFAALLVVDTGALLGLISSWVLGGPAYRWILLCAPLAIIVLCAWGRNQSPKRGRTAGKTRAKPDHMPRAIRPQKAKSKDRRQRSVANRGKR